MQSLFTLIWYYLSCLVGIMELFLGAGKKRAREPEVEQNHSNTELSIRREMVCRYAQYGIQQQILHWRRK
jgi:hypothetical protein